MLHMKVPHIRVEISLFSNRCVPHSYVIKLRVEGQHLLLMGLWELEWDSASSTWMFYTGEVRSDYLTLVSIYQVLSNLG